MLLRNDGKAWSGAKTLAVDTATLNLSSKRATLQVSSPDGSIVSPRRGSPRFADATAAGVSFGSPRSVSPSAAVSGSFLPKLASSQNVEHMAAVDIRLSTGQSVHRRQRESDDFRIRNERSRQTSVSPHKGKGRRSVSPVGRLQRELARRAAEEAANRPPSVHLTGDQRATDAAIRRLADETLAMELESEAMRTRLAVEAEIRRKAAEPKTYKVEADGFATRMAALQAARLEESELPDQLQVKEHRCDSHHFLLTFRSLSAHFLPTFCSFCSRLAPNMPEISWPRRTPKPVEDCTEAIERAEGLARLQKWKTQLMGDAPPVEKAEGEGSEELQAALAAIPAALQRREPALAGGKGRSSPPVDRSSPGGRGSSPGRRGDPKDPDYTTMDWLDTLGRARCRSPSPRRRRGEPRNASPAATLAALEAVAAVRQTAGAHNSRLPLPAGTRERIRL